MTFFIILIFSIFSCNTEKPTTFSEEALNDQFVTLDGNNIPFKTILKAHKGEQIVIDIWASWCRDCIAGMPKVKALQKQYPNVTYVFLSLDKSLDKWKKGIEKHNLKGEHYFMQSGWKGAFGTFVDLDWIPRYMVIDTNGNIVLFKAIKADNQKIKDALQ